MKEPMPFAVVCNSLEIIEKTVERGSTKTIVEIMSNMFRTAIVNSPEDVSELFYFFCTKLKPDFIDAEPCLSLELLTKAVATNCGIMIKDAKELSKSLGDLGAVVAKHRHK